MWCLWQGCTAVSCAHGASICGQRRSGVLRKKRGLMHDAPGRRSKEGGGANNNAMFLHQSASSHAWHTFCLKSTIAPYQSVQLWDPCRSNVKRGKSNCVFLQIIRYGAKILCKRHCGRFEEATVTLPMLSLSSRAPRIRAPSRIMTPLLLGLTLLCLQNPPYGGAGSEVHFFSIYLSFLSRTYAIVVINRFILCVQKKRGQHAQLDFTGWTTYATLEEAPAMMMILLQSCACRACRGPQKDSWARHRQFSLPQYESARFNVWTRTFHVNVAAADRSDRSSQCLDTWCTIICWIHQVQSVKKRLQHNIDLPLRDPFCAT